MLYAGRQRAHSKVDVIGDGDQVAPSRSPSLQVFQQALRRLNASRSKRCSSVARTEAGGSEAQRSGASLTQRNAAVALWGPDLLCGELGIVSPICGENANRTLIGATVG